MDAAYCQCGCGGKTTIWSYNDRKRGFVKGTPKKYLNHHHTKMLRDIPRPEWLKKQISEHHKRLGIKPSQEAVRKSHVNRGKREESPSWRGGISMVNGYRCIYQPKHPRAHPNGYVYEHIAIAEQKIGRSLTDLEIVHHNDGDKLNNDPQNLIVIKNQSEHIKLHLEQRRNL